MWTSFRVNSGKYNNNNNFVMFMVGCFCCCLECLSFSSAKFFALLMLLCLCCWICCGFHVGLWVFKCCFSALLWHFGGSLVHFLRLFLQCFFFFSLGTLLLCWMVEGKSIEFRLDFSFACLFWFVSLMVVVGGFCVLAANFMGLLFLIILLFRVLWLFIA